MKIHVDPERCQGHARCYARIPELFDLDDFGHSSERTPVVPQGLESEAAEAAGDCPERAIVVEQ